METNTVNQPKPPQSAASREIANASAELANLLTSSKLGARVSGLVLSVDEPRNFTGKNADGSSYSTWSRRIQLFAGAGAGAVICGERQEKFEDFGPLTPGLMLDAPILGAKTEGKQMIFRVKL